MFDLEKEIAEWRQKMIAAGIKVPVPLDELENHLREEIERLRQTGMDAKAACETAMEKIGAAGALKIEFAKVEREARVAKQAKVVPVVCLFGNVFLVAVIGAIIFFRFGTFSELTSAQQYSGYAALSLMLLFCFAGRFGYKLFPRICRKKIGGAIIVSAGVALVAWWTILFWIILPRLEYAMAALILALVWGFAVPVGLFFGLIAGIATAARKSVTAN